MAPKGSGFLWAKHADKTCVVLFVDFVRPPRSPVRLVNWLLLTLAFFTPFIRAGIDNPKA